MAWGTQLASPASAGKSAETVAAADTIAPSPLSYRRLLVERTKHQPLFLCSDFPIIPLLGSILRQVKMVCELLCRKPPLPEPVHIASPAPTLLHPAAGTPLP